MGLQTPLTDNLYMIVYHKTMMCTKDYPHDWASCAASHKGDKSRRRSIISHAYSPAMCSDMQQHGKCPQGDECAMSHNIWELWLHPMRYRTQMCRDGTSCTRRVCFFAHTQHELRKPASIAEAIEAVEQQAPQGLLTLQHQQQLMLAQQPQLVQDGFAPPGHGRMGPVSGHGAIVNGQAGKLQQLVPAMGMLQLSMQSMQVGAGMAGGAGVPLSAPMAMSPMPGMAAPEQLVCISSDGMWCLGDAMPPPGLAAGLACIPIGQPQQPMGPHAASMAACQPASRGVMLQSQPQQLLVSNAYQPQGLLPTAAYGLAAAQPQWAAVAPPGLAPAATTSALPAVVSSAPLGPW